MAKKLHVFLRGAAVPDSEQWQAGIIREGFRLALDQTLDDRQNTGFRPAVYQGSQSGFEFNLLPAAAVASDCQGIPARIDGCDVCANFRWAGNVRESIVVYIASAVLAELANGVLYDPQENSFSTGKEAVATVRRLIKAIELD